MMEDEKAAKEKEAALEAKDARPNFSDDDIDSDSDFNDDPEASDAMRKFKEQRLSNFEEDYSNREKRKNKQQGVGEYIQIDEEDFFKYTTRDLRVVVHFYHKDFSRCRIVDKHLKIIAFQHPECKFLYLDVEKAPFLINKLQVRTLPTIGIFLNGINTENIVG